MVDVAEAEMENSLDPEYVSKIQAAKDTLGNCKRILFSLFFMYVT